MSRSEGLSNGRSSYQECQRPSRGRQFLVDLRDCDRFRDQHEFADVAAGSVGLEPAVGHVEVAVVVDAVVGFGRHDELGEQLLVLILAFLLLR